MRNLWMKLTLIAYLLFLLLNTLLSDCPLAVGMSIIMCAVVSFVDLSISYMLSMVMSEVFGRIIFLLFLAHGLYYFVLGWYLYAHRQENFNSDFIIFKSVMLIVVVIPTVMLAIYIYKGKS